MSHPRRLILAWDAPNMDMTLSGLLGRRPNASDRPNFDSVGAWLSERSAAQGTEPVGVVFINVPPGGGPARRGFVQAIRSAGFGVFARPKAAPDDDIDDCMLRFIQEAVAEGDVEEVIVASHDGRAFGGLLGQLARTGTLASVLGFAEFAGWVGAVEGVDIIDLETIPDCFRQPLPRTDLDALPTGGALLPAYRSLGDSQGSAALVSTTASAGAELVMRAVGELSRDSMTGWVLKANLRPTMQRLNPGFSPEAYGFADLDGMIYSCRNELKMRQGVSDLELACADTVLDEAAEMPEDSIHGLYLRTLKRCGIRVPESFDVLNGIHATVAIPGSYPNFDELDATLYAAVDQADATLLDVKKFRQLLFRAQVLELAPERDRVTVPPLDVEALEGRLARTLIRYVRFGLGSQIDPKVVAELMGILDDAGQSRIAQIADSIEADVQPLSASGGAPLSALG